MKEKEKLIIEAAIKLFATKGYASTSIQEIVSESKISKGAFYLYFKSKDALLIAILQYYFEMVERNLEKFEQENLEPREKFIKQLSALFNTLMEHKEFIIMQSREQVIPLNDSVRELMFRKHFEHQQFLRTGLKSIYGEDILAHLWDLSLILEGLFQAYMKLMFFDQNNFEVNEVVPFIMRRMDSVVNDIREETPIVTEEKVEKFFHLTKAFFLKDPIDIKAILDKMKQILSGLKDKEDLVVSLEVLEAEVCKASPRLPVIQGMLSNFKEVPAFDEYVNKILRFYDLTKKSKKI